jgi:hypothetical protein
VADTRDFTDQAITLEDAGDADLVVFPEVGAAVISGAALEQRSMSVLADGSDDSPIETIEPEYFAFADADAVGYLRGFRRAVETIAQDLRPGEEETEVDPAEDPLVIGATWGLIKCKVPPSVRSGVGIKVAMLDTGFDLGHPDFAGRPIVGQTFVASPFRICTVTARTRVEPQPVRRRPQGRFHDMASPIARRSSSAKYSTTRVEARRPPCWPA